MSSESCENCVAGCSSQGGARIKQAAGQRSLGPVDTMLIIPAGSHIFQQGEMSAVGSLGYLFRTIQLSPRAWIGRFFVTTTGKYHNSVNRP